MQASFSYNSDVLFYKSMLFYMLWQQSCLIHTFFQEMDYKKCDVGRGSQISVITKTKLAFLIPLFWGTAFLGKMGRFSWIVLKRITMNQRTVKYF